MGEIIRFISKSERERRRLIRQARAMYDSVFPATRPVSEQRRDASADRTNSGDRFDFTDGIRKS